MLDLFLVYAPIVRPIALMLLPGVIAWLAWVIARPSRPKGRSYINHH